MLGTGTEVVAGITYHEEPLRAVLDELQPHWQAHWVETQREHETMPLDIDLDAYFTLEDQGCLSVVTMRADGVVVGYMTCFLHRHLKSKGVWCGSMDAYYIAPAYRGQGAGAQLFLAAEAALKARGVQRLFGDTKLWHNLGPLLERQGWTAVGVQYTKWIGET
jgi:GNAT superfamily N-acetyltransferase